MENDLNTTKIKLTEDSPRISKGDSNYSTEFSISEEGSVHGTFKDGDNDVNYDTWIIGLVAETLSKNFTESLGEKLITIDSVDYYKFDSTNKLSLTMASDKYPKSALVDVTTSTTTYDDLKNGKTFYGYGDSEGKSDCVEGIPVLYRDYDTTTGNYTKTISSVLKPLWICEVQEIKVTNVDDSKLLPSNISDLKSIITDYDMNSLGELIPSAESIISSITIKLFGN